MLNVPGPLKGEELIQGFLEIIKNPDVWVGKLAEYNAAYEKASKAIDEAIASQEKAEKAQAVADAWNKELETKAKAVAARAADVAEKEKKYDAAFNLLKG